MKTIIKWVKRGLYCGDRAIAFVGSLVIHLYRLTLSPLQKGLSPLVGFPCGCRFYPTCSQYALECLKKYPFLRASWFIFSRLVRCQSLSRCGYDPIP